MEMQIQRQLLWKKKSSTTVNVTDFQQIRGSKLSRNVSVEVALGYHGFNFI